MEKQISIPPKKSKIHIRRSPLALKVVLTVLILFSMASLVALRWVHLDLQQEIERQKTQAAEIEYQNAALEERTQNVGSVDTIEKIARDEFGLVDPNTIVIRPEENYTGEGLDSTEVQSGETQSES